MINEERTIKDFGHTSGSLSYGSDKRVWRVCDGCGDERTVHYRKYTKLCVDCAHKTDEHREKLSDLTKGANNPFYGKTHSTETKIKQSKSAKCVSGMQNPMYGSHHSNETRNKQSFALSGAKNHQWKGGKKLRLARRRATRRTLGFVPHNKPTVGYHAHHIDKNNVIYVPKELHTSTFHSVTKNINMDLINENVCEWFLSDQNVSV